MAGLEIVEPSVVVRTGNRQVHQRALLVGTGVFRQREAWGSCCQRAHVRQLQIMTDVPFANLPPQERFRGRDSRIVSNIGQVVGKFLFLGLARSQNKQAKTEDKKITDVHTSL